MDKRRIRIFSVYSKQVMLLVKLNIFFLKDDASVYVWEIR